MSTSLCRKESIFETLRSFLLGFSSVLPVSPGHTCLGWLKGAGKGWSQEGRRKARLETQLVNKGADPSRFDKAD